MRLRCTIFSFTFDRVGQIYFATAVLYSNCFKPFLKVFAHWCFYLIHWPICEKENRLINDWPQQKHLYIVQCFVRWIEITVKTILAEFTVTMSLVSAEHKPTAALAPKTSIVIDTLMLTAMSIISTLIDVCKNEKKIIIIKIKSSVKNWFAILINLST